MILLSSSLLVSADDNQCSGGYVVFDTDFLKTDLLQSDDTPVYICYTPEPLVRENGCSAPTKFLVGLYNYYFLDACNAHDKCYNTLGVRKDYCDEQFKTDLDKAEGDNIALKALGTIAYKVVALNVFYIPEAAYQEDQGWGQRYLGTHAYQALQRDYNFMPYSSSLSYQEDQQWAVENGDPYGNYEIPEFPTIALPAIIALGLAFFFFRRSG